MAQMWAIKTDTGHFFAFGRTREEAIQRWIGDEEKWEDWYHKGYRAVRVTVVQAGEGIRVRGDRR